MPAKPATRDRAWGTRYDTLKLSTPPPSPAAQRKGHTTASSTPTSPSSRTARDTAHPGPTATPTKSQTTSQDASIFIGSLPTATDYAEVSRLLTDHLSDHPEIKSVKVIRDSKGGTCAFAQCENSSTAVRLLEKLLSTAHQRPFLGRYLRFEHARAFRTLLVSYRVPERTPYPNSGMDSSFDDDGPQDSGLPHAMRIYKAPNAKYHSVVFDTEALDFDSKIASQGLVNEASNAEDPLSGSGLLLSPLRFDEAALREIAEAFGSVEHFRPFVSDDQGSGDGPNLRPHGGQRNPDMDEHIWEIKWEHRDDAMNAQMTLNRNASFLSVTWAHRSYPDTGAGLESRFGSPSLSSSPRFISGQRSRTHSRSHFAPGGELPRFLPAGLSPIMSTLRIPSSPSRVQSALSPKSTPFIPANAPFALLASPSHSASQSLIDSEGQDTTVVASVSETEFPPLHQRGAGRHGGKGSRPPALSWTFQDMHRHDSDSFSHNSVLSTSPSSSLSVQPSTPTPIDTLMSPGPVGSVSSRDEDHDDYQGQEVVMPMTPAFSTASITPITPGTTLSFPHTPLSGRTAISAANSYTGGSFGLPSKESQGFERLDKEIDPLWIFAGGLDVMGHDPWTENKVRAAFGKYGEIEKLEFHHKPGSNCAFAFIKYPDTVASESAVAAEHMRPYNGRTIRVRLREVYPPRHTQKFSKSRPRQAYGPSSFRRPFDNSAQLSDDLRVQPNPQLQESLHRQLQSELPQLSTHETLPQPTYPTIAANELGRSLPGSVSSPAKQARSQDDSHDRPASATSESVSSPPSSTGPVTVGPMHHALMPPQPWMHASAPYVYHMPPYYAGYMGYPPPAGYRLGPTNTDAAAAPYMWANYTYRPNLPGQPYPPQSVVPPPTEASHSQTQPQPPLRPAGFIEGDQLIPLYPPEALNQYMSASSPTTTRTPPPHSASVPQPPPQTVPPATAWPQYMQGPPQMPGYPYPYATVIAQGPSQQPLFAPGQYAAPPWTPAAPAPYMTAPHGFPPSHSQTTTFAQPPLPLHSAPSITGMAASTSFRGVGAPGALSAHATHQDLSNTPRGFHPAGPRRFGREHMSMCQSAVDASPGYGQPFRGVPRSGFNPAHRSPPPHFDRRPSSARDASYGPTGDGVSPSRAHMGSVPHQYFAGQPQHAQMRASGSYPSMMAPNAPVS
ncbi:RNA binding protein [Phanerochaete sordida]|uniref:RNA binding protein n=1 Tax=Phanerochaete sordida TaxID=48140 RepID=A0A9P3G0V3_9APHY|nr:RNA binding protein [Phanerochaete sordida]